MTGMGMPSNHNSRTLIAKSFLNRSLPRSNDPDWDAVPAGRAINRKISQLFQGFFR
jgi:hypothetical protein